MKGLSLACALSAALVGVSFGGPVQAQERFVTIGTSGQTGVYYVAGQSICRFLNRLASKHQIKCNAPASGGGVANVNGLMPQSVEMVSFDKGTIHFLLKLNGTRETDGFANQSLDARSKRQIVTLDTLGEYLPGQMNFVRHLSGIASITGDKV